MNAERGFPAISLAAIIIFSAAVQGTIRTSHHFIKELGSVKGIVRNAVGPVSGLKVTIKNKSIKREVFTNSSGVYEIELPAGVYTITANLPQYYPYLRAPFRVRPNDTSIINLDLILIGIDRVHGGGKELHYETIPLPNATDEQFAGLVAYYDRKEDDEYIVYEGIKLYYDTLVVHALNFRFDKRTLKITATGNVHVDDGRQSDVYVRGADIDFVSGNPTIHLTYGAIDRVSGKGSIDNGNIIFEFEGEIDKPGQFVYQDKKRGISFTEGFYSFGVTNDMSNEVEFGGRIRASQMGRVIPPGHYDPPIDFRCTVRDADDAGRDSFMILFHSVPVIESQGTVTTGRIQIHRRY